MQCTRRYRYQFTDFLFELGGLYEAPALGIFDLDEMDDEIAKHFVLRNFGTYKLTNMRSTLVKPLGFLGHL